MAYYNIFVPQGLPEHLHRRALRAGPSAVSSRGISQIELLARAGFSSVEETDLTAEFLICARAWYEGREAREPELRATFGDAWFEDRQADSRAMIPAIEEGLLRRSLFVATQIDSKLRTGYWSCPFRRTIRGFGHPLRQFPFYPGSNIVYNRSEHPCLSEVHTKMEVWSSNPNRTSEVQQPKAPAAAAAPAPARPSAT